MSGIQGHLFQSRDAKCFLIPKAGDPDALHVGGIKKCTLAAVQFLIFGHVRTRSFRPHFPAGRAIKHKGAISIVLSENFVTANIRTMLVHDVAKIDEVNVAAPVPILSKGVAG